MSASTLRLRRFGLLAILAVTTNSGCTSIGGYTANSSGMGYYKDGNFSAAASEFQTALMSQPNNPDYMANFARSRMKLGDVAGAEQLYRRALTVAPSHQPSYHGLAELMVSQGRSQEATAMLTTWSATQPYVAESSVELAWLQRELGDTQAAAQSLRQALQVNPNHSTALAHLGQYYEEIGRPEQAVALYQQSLQSDWNQPEVHSRVASVSRKVGASSPMAATAMARGVHPHTVPRQATAFGPPSAGAQHAQMQMAEAQMAQRQMVMNGYPPDGFAQGAYGPPMSGSVATSPNMNSTSMTANYSPSLQTAQPPLPPSMAIQPIPNMSFGTVTAETSGQLRGEFHGASEDLIAARQARQLVHEARQALAVNNIPLARARALQARQLQAVWGSEDDRPDRILAEIDQSGNPSATVPAGWEEHWTSGTSPDAAEQSSTPMIEQPSMSFDGIVPGDVSSVIAAVDSGANPATDSASPGGWFATPVFTISESDSSPQSLTTVNSEFPLVEPF